jgi:hypothetical protein
VRLVGWGLGLTAGLAGIGWDVWGREAVVPIVAFGLLATAIQLAAVAALRRGMDAPFRVLVTRWSLGVGLRLTGIVIFAVAVVMDREMFPPLPSALGYLGVVVPLLFMETRFLK